MRLVFAGSSELSRAVLIALAGSRHGVAGVITQPDRPQGRGRKVAASPVKAEALARGFPVWTPEKVGEAAFLETLKAARPDAVVVAAYGQFLPKRFLEIPPRGCLNVHPSLLPTYRGASPVLHAILNGDAVTGISIFQIDARMDAGPVYARREVPIGLEETTGELEARLAPVGAALLLEVLDAIEAGTARAEPQDESQVVLAPKISKEQGRVAWDVPATRAARLIRAMNPWPAAFAFFRGTAHPQPVRVILLRAVETAAAEAGGAEPGTVIEAAKDGLAVAARDGAVRILELQPDGKRRMAARDFVNGYRVKPGDRFDEGGRMKAEG
jgi:methionyl-tRNA formyltransferase